MSSHLCRGRYEIPSILLYYCTSVGARPVAVEEPESDAELIQGVDSLAKHYPMYFSQSATSSSLADPLVWHRKRSNSTAIDEGPEQRMRSSVGRKQQI